VLRQRGEVSDVTLVHAEGCGRLPDPFGGDDLAAAAAKAASLRYMASDGGGSVMSAPSIPVVAGQVPPPSLGLRAIQATDVDRFGPVPRACRRPPKDPPPYDLLPLCRCWTLRSVIG
jgi:hypothetical protein